jgi:uncharacterized membrane protein
MQTHELGRRATSERRAQALGYFSLALGVAQVAAPAKLSELVGIKDSPTVRTVLRALGVREVATGIAILRRPSEAGPLWARVAGDLVDLALIGSAFNQRGSSAPRLALAAASVAALALVDAQSAARLSRSLTVQKVTLPIHVVRSITINRAPETVYHFWRDLQNLPRFMAHLEEVRDQGATSYWRAKAPAGMSVEWEAEITQDEQNSKIAWRSLDGATVPNRGAVCFKEAPGGRGTVVIVELKYDPPGGAVTGLLAKLFGEEPGQQIAGDLRRLKQVLETGSVVHSDASIHRGMHPARPAAAHEAVTLLGNSEAP